MTLAPGTEPRTLRSYQLDAVNAVERDWTNGIRRVGVVLPTGAGKSTVIAQLAANAYRDGKRVVMLAHRGELIDQMVSTVRVVDPSIPAHEIGVVRAEQDDHSAAIVGATLQTLAVAHRLRALGPRDVILWDEVHHAGAEGWHATFTDLGGYDNALMCGFTATMYRAEGRGKIGLGDVMQKISYEKDLKWAIESGYLVRPKGLTVRVAGLDKLDDIRNVAGDFHQGELAEVMEAATEYVVDAINEHAADRRSIVFAASVDAAYGIAEAINDKSDLVAEATTGATTYADRQVIYDRFRSGETDILVTVMVLTEGADFPMCDCVVLARPTRSRNLYSQMVGRSMRLWPGKEDALVLDLSGSTRTMRLINLTQLLPGADTKDVDTDGNEIEIDPEELEDEVGEPTPKIRRQGPVDMVTIDLISGDDTLWLETPAGVPFISLRDGWLAFLWPEGGVKPLHSNEWKWAAGYINTRNRDGGWIEAEQYIHLHEAIERAEEWVVENDFQLPARTASWRRSQPPSEAQLRVAKGLKIVQAADMTKARLSDEISIAFAARALDGAME